VTDEATTLPVSVVIPAYNRPSLVLRAVRSALAEGPRPPAEVIVVDDCSGDETGAAAGAAGARVIRHEANQGEGAGRNTAIRAASQPWATRPFRS
jgi:glycosyltransferase involved in cell wall biosynthesis